VKHETGSSDQQAASRVQQRERGEVDFDPPSRGMGIDATMKFKDAKFPPVNKVSSALIDKVAARWDEFGLPGIIEKTQALLSSEKRNMWRF
jgi:hypothetical protein